MPYELGAGYKSAAQRVRVVSEAWAADNVYCPCCPADQLERCGNNRQAVDFLCGACESPFQLKSSGKTLGSRIVDGAFSAMDHAITFGSTPNLLILGYDAERWTVRSLMLVPSFAFTGSAIEKRPPLKPDARRAGWVGCNILLGNIPVDLRIAMVANWNVAPEASVRQQYAALQPLKDLALPQRGWTLDVLNVVRKIGKQEFALGDVYEYEGELKQLHPHNLHVRDKIRQQLQQLRDLGLLEFLGDGMYQVR